MKALGLNNNPDDVTDERKSELECQMIELVNSIRTLGLQIKKAR